VLNNWCSDLGKAGYHTVEEQLLSGQSQVFRTTANRAKYVSSVLLNMSFVYKDPEATGGVSRISFLLHCAFLMAV
jgi:hypothetical protein